MDSNKHANSNSRPPPMGEALAEAGGQQGPGKLKKMKAMYDLQEGRLQCRCLIRKCEFCPEIQLLAGGRVTPRLLKCNEDGGGGKVRGRGRVGQLRVMLIVKQPEAVTEGDGGNEGGKEKCGELKPGGYDSDGKEFWCSSV